LYDASDTDAVITNTSATGNVLEWHDKSTNGYHMISVGGNRPTYGTNVINGLKALHFDSTFDEMTTNGIPDINCTNILLISIGQSLASGTYPNYGTLYKTDGTDKLHIRRIGTNNRLGGTVNLDGTSVEISHSNDPDYATDVPFMFAVYYDGDKGYIRGNGGSVSNVTDVANGATFTINEIQCGRDNNTMRQYHGEMIVLNTSDFSTIEKVEGYLAWKWGLEGKLPADHTYKNAAPQVSDGILFMVR
jgi:hypothetical protein